MNKCWTIKLYVTDTGKNHSQDWLNAQDDSLQAKIDSILRHLEITRLWAKPYYRKLKSYQDLHEIIVQYKGDPYRLFGYFGPKGNEFTIFCCAQEKGKNNYLPPNAMDLAESYQKQLLNGKGKTYDYTGPQKKSN